MEGVRGFYGKQHLGEPIRITGQEGASSDIEDLSLRAWASDSVRGRFRVENMQPD